MAETFLLGHFPVFNILHIYNTVILCYERLNEWYEYYLMISNDTNDRTHITTKVVSEEI